MTAPLTLYVRCAWCGPDSTLFCGECRREVPRGSTECPSCEAQFSGEITDSICKKCTQDVLYPMNRQLEERGE